MEKTRVTSAVLREMAIGETRTFDLPDARAIENGKALAYRMKHILRCTFRATSDYANNQLTITKEDLHI